MGQTEARFLSLPHRVHFCGFTAPMPVLQQAGWEFAAQEDQWRMHITLAMRHQEANLRGITAPVHYDFFMRKVIQDRYSDDHVLDFFVVKMAHELMMSTWHDPNQVLVRSEFKAIDAYPQLQMTSIDNMGIFAVPLARTQEIIIDPNDVNKLMDRILEIQKPEQAALRKKQRDMYRREGADAGSLKPIEQRQVFHAQILSIAA